MRRNRPTTVHGTLRDVFGTLDYTHSPEGDEESSPPSSPRTIKEKAKQYNSPMEALSARVDVRLDGVVGGRCRAKWGKSEALYAATIIGYEYDTQSHHVGRQRMEGIRKYFSSSEQPDSASSLSLPTPAELHVLGADELAEMLALRSIKVKIRFQTDATEATVGLNDIELPEVFRPKKVRHIPQMTVVLPTSEMIDKLKTVAVPSQKKTKETTPKQSPVPPPASESPSSAEKKKKEDEAQAARKRKAERKKKKDEDPFSAASTLNKMFGHSDSSDSEGETERPHSGVPDEETVPLKPAERNGTREPDEAKPAAALADTVGGRTGAGAGATGTPMRSGSGPHSGRSPGGHGSGEGISATAPPSLQGHEYSSRSHSMLSSSGLGWSPVPFRAQSPQQKRIYVTNVLPATPRTQRVKNMLEGIPRSATPTGTLRSSSAGGPRGKLRGEPWHYEEQRPFRCTSSNPGWRDLRRMTEEPKRPRRSASVGPRSGSYRSVSQQSTAGRGSTGGDRTASVDSRYVSRDVNSATATRVPSIKIGPRSQTTCVMLPTTTSRPTHDTPSRRYCTPQRSGLSPMANPSNSPTPRPLVRTPQRYHVEEITRPRVPLSSMQAYLFRARNDQQQFDFSPAGASKPKPKLAPNGGGGRAKQ